MLNDIRNRVPSPPRSHLKTNPMRERGRIHAGIPDALADAAGYFLEAVSKPILGGRGWTEGKPRCLKSGASRRRSSPGHPSPQRKRKRTSWQHVLRGEGNGARRGFTLIELFAACILLGVVFSVSIPLLTVVAHERRSAEQRQFALQHATNLLERATIKSWSELSVGNQELTAAPTDVQTLLPGLERRVEVKELSAAPRSKQVEVSVRWKSRSGELVAPLRLSAWVYPNGEGQP